MSEPAAATMPTGGGGRLSRVTPEIKLTALLFLFSFFIAGVPRVFTQNAAYSLFIAAYGAKAVPYAYIAQAFCVPLGGWIYMIAEHRLKLRPLLLATLAFNAMVLIGFRIGLFLNIPFVAAATIVWFEIEFVLSSLLLWGLANQLMTLRQGKRLFGFIVAGEPVAIIVCGLGTPTLMKFLTTPDLFLLSALGAIVGFVLVLYITSHYQPPADAAGGEEEQSAGEEQDGAVQKAWWKDKYIAVMIAMIFLSQMVYFFNDETFYLAAEHRFPQEEAMASFLGVYSAIMGSISLFVSLFVAGPLVRRFGVRGGLLTLPSLVLIGSVAAVIIGELNGVAGALFFILVGTKIADQSFRYTIDKTTSVTLYQPLPAGQRMKLQAFLESVIEPISGGIAGLLLSFLIHQLHFSAIGVSAVIAVIVATWLAFVFILSKGYAEVLRNAVAGRRFEFDPEAEMSDDAIAAIRQSLGSRHIGEVLYALQVLGDRPDGLTTRNVSALLEHDEPAVRIAAARWFEGRHEGAEQSIVEERLACEIDPDVRGALIAALAGCSRENAIELVSVYLDADSAAEQLGAYQGLIQHGGIEGVIVAGNRLISDIQDNDAGRRSFAAEVMRKVGSHLFYRPLMRLLDDDNEDVRAAALSAAGAIHAPPLWPSIIASLSSTRLTQPAIGAIGAIGDAMLEPLAGLYDDPASTRSARRAAILACAAIGTQAAFDWLMERLDEPLRELRHTILAGLWRCDRRAAPADIGRIRAQIAQEVETAGWMLRAWRDCMGEGEAQALVTRALIDEIDNAQEAVFQLLNLIIAEVDMHETRLRFISGGATQRSYVLEMLDNLLDNETKIILLPFLEPETLEEKLAALAKRAGAEEQETTIDGVAGTSEARLGAWAPASALYALSQLGSGVAVRMAEAASDADDAVLRETALWIANGSMPIGERRDMLLTIEKVLILRSVGIFANVRESALTQVAQTVREVKIKAGETLFEQGDFGDALYIIANGKLRIHIGDLTLAEIGERQVVGEMSALDPEPRSASISAAEDSLLLRMSSDNLERLIADDIRVARGIIRELCNRIRNANKAVAPAVNKADPEPEMEPA
jgi:ATP/ADP translocase/HEAT repeat protein